MSDFLLQFRGEWRKLFARKRTLLAFAVCFGVELFLPLLLEVRAVKATFRTGIEQLGRPFDEYFSALTVALIVMRATLFVTGALYVALVGGDIVAKEVEDGAMRMLLCRPVTRFRLVALKAVASNLYAALLAVFIGGAALLAGWLFEKPGGLFAVGFLEHVAAFHDFTPGLLRYLAILPMIAIGFITVNSVAFFLSCFDVKPVTATIGTLTIFFVDYLLHLLPFFEPLEAWFISTRLSLWMRVFEYDINWPQLLENLTLLLAVDVTLFILAAAHFERRDFKA